ncbi:hypothetical protein BDZ94DRAFT_1209300 [Collybia nuda]|uniref:DUF1365-domain-containing protein n=1 Tax=Collybia nuda TaxID=64659 RepID=A0A9P5YE35_9AGAR|nr:hypothetical protein BDZ94DRAFT_1209300 [Collybia nuda]
MSAFLLLDISFSIICVGISAILYSKRSSQKDNICPQGYILENQVTHARLLPLESSHAFTYPTVSLLLSLDALEAHSLDIYRGWAFGYGGLWGRLLGLRSDPYLTAQRPGGHQTIRGKLEALLSERRFLDGGNILQDAWMMTMPSFMGFEGINPLTVYFCYKSGQLWLVVLEIHNTFGETHVHVLEIGTNEDENPPRGYDHQWTFLREFHVSPFNDRSGYYVISIKSPTHAPMKSAEYDLTPPRPTVRIHLRAPLLSDATIPGDLKLTALLRPTVARPLGATSLFLVIIRIPFALLLSFPRILAEAWKLHYRKRLDVYIRPEPFPVVQNWAAEANISSGGPRLGGGVKWISEGLLEGYARRSLERFLDRRVNETGVTVTLVAADSAIGSNIFTPVSHDRTLHLKVWYLSPRFFTIMFLCPSAAHALLLGSDSEGLFFTSDRELFLSTFSAKTTFPSRLGFRQRFRTLPIPDAITLAIPTRHIFDDNPHGSIAVSGATIWIHFALELLEAYVFRIARARTVQGQEPWKQWERAGAKFREN